MGESSDPSLRRDVGNGIVCASFTASGAWLSVGRVDAVLGFVELNGLDRFDESQRSDVPSVRRYRVSMTEVRSALLRVDGAMAIGRDVPIAGTRVVQHYTSTGGTATISLRGRLDRPAYAEITDVSPLPPTRLTTSMRVDGRRLVLSTQRPGVGAEIAVDAPVGGRLEWTVIDDRRAELRLGTLEAGSTFAVVVDIGPAVAVPATETSATRAATSSPPWLVVPAHHRGDVERIAGGAIRYTRECTALAAGDRARVILTDHRVLQLSWTRDAYYQALALLADGERGVVEDHLRWLWCHCLRTDGRWQRSHQAHGDVKDWAIQADQQLYPVLELLDFRADTGRWPALTDGTRSDWGDLVRQAWAALPRDGVTGLLASEENAADDATQLPLLLSTQVLYWHVATRLAAVGAELGTPTGDVTGEADAIRMAIHEHFTVSGRRGPQWAYAADGHGRHQLYHDANDVPLALAPLFGFIGAEDPVWDTTMSFAFSADNPAFVAGTLGGLGSAHTPGVWPLGDVQEWVWASLRGDAERVSRVLARLARVADADGLLPETYDPRTGAWQSRHWFAWPGAVVAALVYGGFG